MAEHQIVTQKEYATLEDFVRGQNNFYAHFLDDCEWGQLYRKSAHFKRFQKAHPDMETETTRATVSAIRVKPRQKLPYEQLFEAYKLMSHLVFVDDEYVMHYGQPDKCFLIR